MKMMKILKITSQKHCLLDGMESPFQCGCTNFMEWAKSTNVKYAATSLIGDEGLLKNTFRSGDTALV